MANRLKTAEINAIGVEVPTNGAAEAIEFSMPYIAQIRLQGVADMLFHRYDVDSVAAQSKAAKGSKAKKTDNVESFVYRNDQGFLCIPGEMVRQSIITAAKFRQDPRSPRKSAMDLYKAGVVSLTPLSSLGKKDWDYLDKRRVVVQRGAVSRSRPAVKAGWEADFQLSVLLPEYIPASDLHDVLVNAGRLIGIADFRPTYGRFSVIRFDVS